MPYPDGAEIGARVRNLSPRPQSPTEEPRDDTPTECNGE